MAERSFDKVVRDLGSDFAVLRDDLRKLTEVVSDLAHDDAEDPRGGLARAVDRARDRYSDTAERLSDRFGKARDRYGDKASSIGDQVSDGVGRVRERYGDVSDRVADGLGYASERVKGAGAEIEGRIGRNPMTAVMLAVLGGLLIGAISRSRR